jgi:hypothetical protein
LAPVKVLLFPIPAEELGELSAILAAASTLPAEVSATLNAMAQTAPSRQAIFPNGAAEPAKGFGQVITDSQVTDVKVVESKAGAPGAPLSSSNGGGGTMDDNLRRISDNVNRTVEQKQLDPSASGG